MTSQLLGKLHEYYLAHVFAVGVAEEAVLDHRPRSCLHGGVVQEVPESHSSVAGASRKSSDGLVFLDCLHSLGVGVTEPDLVLGAYFLHVMNGSIVRKEGPDDGGFRGVLYIPEKHHLVAVNDEDSVGSLIGDDGQHV
eukprot:CAMPEP_0170512068 /NCGR_PEP_ID=MMETSP0208-20121228/66646_1 /TAXON_ID=197538 /ORGANISM="Strombidium inclinatum, Strain S3" /LENGTH=137 /DNA_ID=CAMNT_0010795663 /DNA_START=3262 /DNA_END=3675 /DNA_ORIENTATION=-